MNCLPEMNPSPTTKSSRSFFLSWRGGLLILLVLGILIGVGTGVRHWQLRQQSLIQAKGKIFEGMSGHWDQSSVPVSLQCGACHEKEFRQWADSDHAWAFRRLDAKWDAEAFHGMEIQAHGSTIHFTTGEEGNRHIHDDQMNKTWDASWATGRIPLVQYIVPAKDGGFHTLSAAWDVKNKEWFDIFGKDQRNLDDWGHWTGRGMNWNTQCAWCHMTNFQKNYDSTKDQYNSKWIEPGVTCLQCHDPLLTHPDAKTGCMVSPDKKLTAQQIRDNCASCHARRDEFDHDFKAGDLFDDHFQLVLPVQLGIFWPNGMQRDEDYCETGIRLSRMGKAGVTCLDCHDPHTGKLKLTQEDNALCLRCHGTGEKVNGTSAPIIDMPKHSPCPAGSTGARCVECHMPESLYMARDPRRDHSFNSPDPLLSVELGIPNACTMCHKDQSNTWAAEIVEKYYGKMPKMARYRDRTRAVELAYRGDTQSLSALLRAYPNQEVGAWRATLLELLDTWSSDPRVVQLARTAIKDEDPLVRAAVAKIMGHAGDLEVKCLLNDPVKVVRLQAEWALRDQLPADSSNFQELVRTALHQSDQPSGAMKMASLEAGKNNIESAKKWFDKALQWDSSSSVVHRDYSVFLASQGQLNEAIQQMTEAVRLAPQDANLWYLLGLGQQENGANGSAMKSFNEAIRLVPNFVRALYNRALLNDQMGQMEAALSDLENCSALDQEDAEIPYTIAIIYYRQARYDKAISAATKALRRNPSHQGAREILERASQQP
ncbi:MAG: ammonia-forming cytochrome c nitrite reductase subunit c552 [Akkermansia sp.]